MIGFSISEQIWTPLTSLMVTKVEWNRIDHCQERQTRSVLAHQWRARIYWDSYIVSACANAMRILLSHRATLPAGRHRSLQQAVVPSIIVRNTHQSPGDAGRDRSELRIRVRAMQAGTGLNVSWLRALPIWRVGGRSKERGEKREEEGGARRREESKVGCASSAGMFIC